MFSEVHMKDVVAFSDFTWSSHGRVNVVAGENDPTEIGLNVQILIQESGLGGLQLTFVLKILDASHIVALSAMWDKLRNK